VFLNHAEVKGSIRPKREGRQMAKITQKSDTVKKKDNRGTKDEIEALAYIVTNVAAVKTQVMLRLREAKDRVLKQSESKLRKMG